MIFLNLFTYWEQCIISEPHVTYYRYNDTAHAIRTGFMFLLAAANWCIIMMQQLPITTGWILETQMHGILLPQQQDVYSA